jgi:hypothetical protein
LTTTESVMGLPPKVPSSSTKDLDGDWPGADIQLQDKKCCIIKVSNLEPSLQVLQEALVHVGPLDVDLRARIQTSQSTEVSYRDCRRVLQSLMRSVDDNTEDLSYMDHCAVALHELARGMASMANGCGSHGIGCNDDTNATKSMDVLCRIVCASNYHARHPPFHTDKTPLRGYVTLKGLGTEYMQRTCNPLEYLALRVLGDDVPDSITKSLRHAREKEFIVMKGDHYHHHDGSSLTILDTLWTRAAACVHRSPPNKDATRRRVIISFDLADGSDDREWHQAGKKREWRNGLTQRKSRLVA